MEKSTVYIDESGDLGQGKGTRWFVITAVVVDAEKERSIRNAIQEIKNNLRIPEVHFRKVCDFNKRLFLTSRLSKEDFTYINVIADTNKMDYSKIPSPAIAYNYMCRMLIERVSWFLRDNKRGADIILSARGTKRDNELVTYINKLIKDDNSKIEVSTLGNIKATCANTLDLLQLADVCATTTFLAYEKGEFGIAIPCFFKMLESHLYKYNGEVNRYGIKFFNNEMLPDADNECPCIIKERTFGATATRIR